MPTDFQTAFKATSVVLAGIVILLGAVDCSGNAGSRSGTLTVNAYTGSELASTYQRIALRISARSKTSFSGYIIPARNNRSVTVRIIDVGSVRHWLLNGRPMSPRPDCATSGIPQIAISPNGKYFACVTGTSHDRLYLAEIEHLELRGGYRARQRIVADDAVPIAFRGESELVGLVEAGRTCAVGNAGVTPSRVALYDMTSRQYKLGVCANGVQTYGLDGIALIRYVGEQSEQYSIDDGNTWRDGSVLGFWNRDAVFADSSGHIILDDRPLSVPGTPLSVFWSL